MGALTTIAKQRAEILGLLSGMRGTLDSSSGGSQPSGQKGDQVSSSKGFPAVVAQKRDDLMQAADRRAQLERTLTERRLLATIESLGKRVMRLEELVAGRSPTAAAASPAAGDSASLAAQPTLADLMLGGTIEQSMLADILQMLSSNLASGEFVVQGGESKVALYFSEGQIVHAVGPGVTGEQAVFAALAIESGTFTMRQVAELPKERSVQSKAQFLILEALRRIDEARAGSGKGGR